MIQGTLTVKTNRRMLNRDLAESLPLGEKSRADQEEVPPGFQQNW